MERRNVWIAAVICLVLFIGGCLLSTLPLQNDNNEWVREESGNIVLSEIMASNRTYPAPDGQFLDFIEVHNLSGDSVDISGYMISDDLDSIGYTFPAQTILPPYGYALCWCNKDSVTDEYANFGISKHGGDTICLYNNVNVLVDQAPVPPMSANQSLVRTDNETWSVANQSTPGYENTPAGYQLWLSSIGGSQPPIVISEVMTDNSCITAGIGMHPYDWVELTNTGAASVTLLGAYLSNDPADPLKWQIPALTLEAGQSSVIDCSSTDFSPSRAPFGLSKTGCTVTLTGLLGNTLSQVSCPALETDHSYALGADGSYQITDLATPGFSNDSDGYDAWMQAIGAEDMAIAISEIMTANRSTIVSQSGILCDWVELTNVGTAPAVLDGAFLSDDPAERGKWRMDSLSVAPGQSVVIPLVGGDATGMEATFALPKAGASVILSGPRGNIIAKAECPRLEDDRSYALQPDGTYLQTDMPTPGFPNTENGYLSYCKIRGPMGALAISEVMPANDRYMMQSDGRYYDWVELINCSDAPVNLEDYTLSNDPDRLGLFPLPRRTLNPGERITIICSANEDLVGKAIQAPFTLSAEECWVYIADSSGRLSDYMRIHDVPYQGSMGRIEDDNCPYYFSQPTPDRPNGAGVALVSQTPDVLTPGGIYNDVSEVTVALEGEAPLHYTLDGSIPTQASPVYTAPISLTETSVLRVVSLAPGKLPSDVRTAGYIINENHTLPVLSLTADPEALFGPEGLYNQTPVQDGEIPCDLTFFEDSGSFSATCGLELAGNRTLPQKSFQVNFRGRYGADVLGYPLFGSDGPQIFDALRIQSGRDYDYTLFRNELFESLSLQLDGNAFTQHSKFCVLYINGEYWGIRSLKAPIDEMLYAQTENVSLSSITALEEPVIFGTDMDTLAAYSRENDLTEKTHYDFVAAQLDLDSLIDWMILQGYSCNDIGDNLSYFRSPENGNKWQLAIYDFDNAFSYRTGFDSVFQPIGDNAYLALTKNLIRNDDFRQRFLQRLSDQLSDTLSKENVLSLMEHYTALLEPEIARDRQLHSQTPDIWHADVKRLQTFITRYDHRGLLIENLKANIGLTEEEAAQYFGEVTP